jgi:hypothetical protein
MKKLQKKIIRLHHKTYKLYLHEKIFILLVLLSTSYIYTQKSFTISEKEYITACGKLLIVDAIWMNDGIIMTDISMLEKPNSKPIRGGYKLGDEITLSSEEGCTYYISSIIKYGIDSSYGKVMLSKKAPTESIGFCEDSYTFTDGFSIAVDSLDWHIYSIQEGIAYVKASSNTAYISEFTLTEGSMIWLKTCLYKVERIKAAWWDKEKDPQGNYEKNPPEIYLKRIQSSIYNK